MTHRQSLDFGEFAKEAHAKASCGFRSDKSDEVGRDQIVSIELFFDRAILLGQIDGGTDRGYQHQVVGIACDADRNRTRIWIGRRWSLLSAVHMRNSLPRRWASACLMDGDSKGAHNARGPAGSSVSARNRSRPGVRAPPWSRA